MLRALGIRDFVLVESLDLDFSPGMTVLTGETGAGKSILVDALSLALGDRAESGVVRRGAKRAEIYAEFEIGNAPAVQSWLEQSGLDAETCILRRVVEAEGRSRAFINGSPVTLAQIKELGEELVDIHGQHAHHALLKSAVQRELLDEYADAAAEARDTAEAWRAWQNAKKRLQSAREEAGARLLEKEGLEAALAEVAPLLDTLQSWEGFQVEHQRQGHMSSLIETSGQLLSAIEDDEFGILHRLHAARAHLQAILERDASVAEEGQLFDTVISDMEEVRHGLNRYADRLSLDPQRMAELDRRMVEVLRVSRKHRLTPMELFERHAAWEQRLAELEASQDIETLELEAGKAEQLYFHQASTLSALRKQASSRLVESVMQAMAGLALGDGRFEVRTSTCEPQSHGLEEVRFMVSSHASLPVDALDKVASGGELSRISLAIQTALSGQAGVPTLIFDEVDVGIGGAVAEAVGRRLAQVAATRQVLVVTHLPQVAAWGGQHYRVSKLAGKDKVVSQVALLSGEERSLEIARMMGGKEISATTLQHAREMLEASDVEKLLGMTEVRSGGGREKTA
jgi:DNA repair protein RecN (Recombination protein N)